MSWLAARAASAAVLLLTLAAGFAGCQSFDIPREIDVQAAPISGMRASYRVDSVARVSGPGARSLAESQKSAAASLRYALEVGAVRERAFDVRLTSEQLQGVITGEFARDWTPLRFGVLDDREYAEMDLGTFPVVGEALRMQRELAGRWKVGATRPWTFSMRVPPYLEAALRGSVALRKITTWRERRAAEFHYDAAGDGEYTGAPLRMGLTGQCWIDLATGFALEVRLRSRGDFARSGQALHIEITEERRLDLAASRGL